MTQRQAYEPEQEESHFVSMTDMMVGVLFVFIIMLMAFALNLRESTDNLTQSLKTRTEILVQIKAVLRERGVDVKIDEKQGILRLPEQILFSRGSSILNPSGVEKIKTLGDVLGSILPCYVHPLYNVIPPIRLNCKRKRHYIDNVLIEGHTDSTKFGEDIDKNWNLSSERAINAFRELVVSQPSLGRMRNSLEQKILSVSGYADSRPTNTEDTESGENRRIDLRFIMSNPHTAAPIKSIEKRYEEK
jgi:flagellar motor protein MotB